MTKKKTIPSIFDAKNASHHRMNIAHLDAQVEGGHYTVTPHSETPVEGIPGAVDVTFRRIETDPSAPAEHHGLFKKK